VANDVAALIFVLITCEGLPEQIPSNIYIYIYIEHANFNFLSSTCDVSRKTHIYFDDRPQVHDTTLECNKQSLHVVH
jgi:hypothetical protein